MAETKLETLVLAIEARTAQFDKALKKIERNTSTSFGKSEKSVDRFGLRLKTLSLTARGAAVSLASLGGVSIGAGLVTAIKSTTSEIVDLAAEAERAGLSFEAFQELQFATAKQKVSIDALTDGIKEMQLRADEFIVTGKGSGADAFNRLGYSADVLKTKLREPDKLFEDIIGRLEQLDKAAQIRVADEIFGGTGGEQFVQLLDDGARGIRQARQEARDMGRVMSDDVLEKAKEIDRQFQTITATIAQGMKSAVVNVASALSDLIAKFFELERAMPKDGNSGLSSVALRRKSRGTKAKSLDEIFGTTSNSNYPDGAAGRYQRRLAKRIWATASAAHSVSDVDVSDIPTVPNVPNTGDDEKAQKKLDRIQDVILALEEEAQQLGRTSNAQELYNALKQAGVSLESEEGQAIAEAVTALQYKRAEMQRAMDLQKELELSTREVKESFEYLGQSSVDTLLSIADGSMTAEDAMKRLALQIANAALQASLFGQGALSGLFTSLGGSSNGLLGGLFSSLASSVVGGGSGSVFSTGFLFDRGGYTGNKPASAVAGIVHGGEYVFSKRATDRIGAGNLEALHRQLKGYAKGGYVGGLFNPSIMSGIEPNRAAMAGAGNAANSNGPSITMNVYAQDAQSFRKSEGQISASLARMSARGKRNM
ncbi:hypothetical protein [uncultured Cohaesibacter sp.]|uniref:hypothetical protein n=1 Tax=uncultured Cohaesibacter sp. TaxID=1002546 RepID=UPI0029C85716|nr:hypothetical protein [uncultured Cohaesibacter sp.]